MRHGCTRAMSTCALPSLSFMLLLSITTQLISSSELPLTPAPIPDCSTLQPDFGSVHYMLQPTLAALVCGYASFHGEVSRGDTPLRAVVFSPGKHQLGNRVLELSTMFLLSMCAQFPPNIKIKTVFVS